MLPIPQSATGAVTPVPQATYTREALPLTAPPPPGVFLHRLLVCCGGALLAATLVALPLATHRPAQLWVPPPARAVAARLPPAMARAVEGPRDPTLPRAAAPVPPAPGAGTGLAGDPQRAAAPDARRVSHALQVWAGHLREVLDWAYNTGAPVDPPSQDQSDHRGKKRPLE